MNTLSCFNSLYKQNHRHTFKNLIWKLLNGDVSLFCWILWGSYSNRQPKGGSAEFQATPEGVCSIMQCDRAVSNHVFRNKRFHRAVLSDNRFTEKQRMTISPNSSNVSCKQLLNTWRKSSDSPSATLFYSWIVWGLNSRWVWLLWHHTHPRAEKTPTAPGTASTETTGLPIKIKQPAPAGWLKETSMFLCTADGAVDRF